MTTRLPNPFLASPQGGRQTAAVPVSSPVSAAAVTNPAPEVMALTAPGMARGLGFQAKATEGKAGNAEGLPLVRQTTTGTGLRVGEADADQPATSEFMDVTAGETATNSDGRSTAVRAFGPGDVLARFETDLASIVADINAHERFMRGLPAFIAAPSAAYLAAINPSLEA